MARNGGKRGIKNSRDQHNICSELKLTITCRPDRSLATRRCPLNWGSVGDHCHWVFVSSLTANRVLKLLCRRSLLEAIVRIEELKVHYTDQPMTRSDLSSTPTSLPSRRCRRTTVSNRIKWSVVRLTAWICVAIVVQECASSGVSVRHRSHRWPDVMCPLLWKARALIKALTLVTESKTASTLHQRQHITATTSWGHISDRLLWWVFSSFVRRSTESKSMIVRT
jgi:hypothetical protein